MSFQGLNQFSFIDFPKLNRAVCTTWNQIGRIAWKSTVPYPFEVPFQNFILCEVEFIILFDLEKLNPFIGRASRQKFVIRRNFHFQNVVIMGLNRFAFLGIFWFLHNERLDHSFIVCTDHIPLVIADWDRSNSNFICSWNGMSFSIGSDVPYSKVSSLISS